MPRLKMPGPFEKRKTRYKIRTESLTPYIEWRLPGYGSKYTHCCEAKVFPGTVSNRTAGFERSVVAGGIDSVGSCFPSTSGVVSWGMNLMCLDKLCLARRDGVLAP
ncbi:hypothetical protein BaRGS_00014459 [Batillaria attramentaria]|uniref:Uncharacterized protein n=1 Tax=Batillaria attramentaria TaxID=370345 RepID=A0ABD0L4X1_9CAEN